ncbi:MAG: hypothetical protein K2K96_11275 [Lachnospiraceae bacterium]|nr:hypothetical protein [Lachnospiraceae bacterium]
MRTMMYLISKRRSWTTFGSILVTLGIFAIFMVVFLGVEDNHVSMIGIIVGIVGLLIAFLGIRIIIWDKSFDAKMSRIDPNLDYHFFLSFRGMEQEVKDFSKIEEVLKAFDLGKEAWDLKIVPPMGTLSEWKGYYNDKEKTWVMEIAFVREEGIQRCVRRCVSDGMVNLNRKDLKKIMVDKKKADLLLFGRID